jgi:hypothetical protein
LACSLYVDLNPIRAGECTAPEASRHTSAKGRIDERQQRTSAVEMLPFPPSTQPADGSASDRPASDRSAADWLAPLTLDERRIPGPQVASSCRRASDKGFLPMSLNEYLTLLDWTGRQLVPGKRGAIPTHLGSILA